MAQPTTRGSAQPDFDFLNFVGELAKLQNVPLVNILEYIHQTCESRRDNNGTALPYRDKNGLLHLMTTMMQMNGTPIIRDGLGAWTGQLPLTEEETLIEDALLNPASFVTEK